MKKLLALLCAACAAGVVSSALGITNGAPDGNGHPNVGSVLAPKAYSDGTWTTCSGTLISPTVFLTAAHCDQGITTVNVTFASDYKAGMSKTYAGTWHADARYRKAQGNPYDIAVIVFAEPVEGITPALLPKAGSLDALRQGDTITAVGYGAQSVTMGAGGATFHYQDTRFVATGTVNTVTPSWLRASMNPAKGDGGTCYGDSGGPNFLRTTNVVAATTITGDTPCRATNVDYRLDTASARSFLADYVTLP